MPTKADKEGGGQFWFIFCGRPLWMTPRLQCLIQYCLHDIVYRKSNRQMERLAIFTHGSP